MGQCVRPPGQQGLQVRFATTKGEEADHFLIKIEFGAGETVLPVLIDEELPAQD